MPFRHLNPVLSSIAAATVPSGARLVLLLWLTGFCLPGAAQTPEGLPVLTNAAQVLELGILPATRLRQPIRLTGVVSFHDVQRGWFFVQDETAGVLVIAKDTSLAHTPGELIEVEGVSGGGSFAAYVDRASVKVLGTASLPHPLQATLAELNANRHFGQYVETTAVVRDLVMLPNRLQVLVASEHQHTTLSFWGFPPEQFPQDWLEARIRMRGINWAGEGFLKAQTTNDILFLTPGTTNLFNKPLVTAASVWSQPASDSGERVLLKAVVQHHTPGREVFLRDATTAFRAVPLTLMKTYHPTDLRMSQPASGDLQPGDVVEIIGERATNSFGLVLEDAQYRVTGNSPATSPASATARQIASNRFENELVTVRGEVVQQLTNSITDGFRREELVLRSDGVIFAVIVDSPTNQPALVIEPDRAVETTGFVTRPDPSGRAFQVQARTAADVRTVGYTVAARSRLMLRAFAGLSAVGLVAGAWIVLLRRKIARQESVEARIRELNASLESRVEERTAQLKLAQANLEKALAQEKELTRLKSNFVSMVSHEFRTPLGVISVSAEVLQRYFARLTAEQRAEHLDAIIGNVRRMSRMMEDVLLLSRVDSGRMEFQPQPLHLEPFCRKLVDEMLSATNRACPIEFQCDPPVNGGARADESLLRHILTNLMSNAVKYSPLGTPVSLRVTRHDSDAVFEVADRGMGIPPEDEAKLFNAFHRARNAEHIHGTGLGLVIVKRCCDLHGGTISVHSEMGKGTTFTARLPLFPPTPAPTPATTSSEIGSSSRSGRGRGDRTTTP